MTWPFFADEAGLGMSTNQVFHFCWWDPCGSGNLTQNHHEVSPEGSVLWHSAAFALQTLFIMGRVCPCPHASCRCPCYDLAGASWTCWTTIQVSMCYGKQKKSEKSVFYNSHLEVKNDTSGWWTDKDTGTPLTWDHCAPRPIQPLGNTKDQHRGAGGPCSGLAYDVCLLKPHGLSILSLECLCCLQLWGPAKDWAGGEQSPQLLSAAWAGEGWESLSGGIWWQ